MKYGKFKFVLSLVLLIISNYACVFAYPKGTQFSKGFKVDEFGYNSFYYDNDKFYNDGWHLLDTNGDGLYEYYYFSISGHYLISNTAPNGCILNEKGLLLNADNTIYQISFIDINNALFLNKVETADEIKLGLKADYNYVFNNWYISATTDINNRIAIASIDMSINKANVIREEISKHTKKLKKMSKWYEDRINKSRDIGTIDKNLSRELIKMMVVDMSTINNKFREESNNKIKVLGY